MAKERCMPESKETPRKEAKSHSKGFLDRAAALKKGNSKGNPTKKV